MIHHAIILPEYAHRFRCLGGDCKDTCCQGWKVLVDKDSFEKYRAFPPGKLQCLVGANVKHVETAKPEMYASIDMLPGGVCPFLSEKRLCMIQEEHGESYLCRTCAVFPRSPHCIDGINESPLTLSCPEAARLVLCDLKLLRPGKVTYFITRTETDRKQPLTFYFWQIRNAAISLIRQRRLAFWERMFLLGIFARRLDAIAHGEELQDVTRFLNDFASATDVPALRDSMRSIPADPGTQLEMVVSLVNLRSSSIGPGPRLLEILEHFARGIGIGPQPAISREQQIEAYQSACDRYYEPFFRRHPHMLENYILNEIFRGTFPFGRALFDAPNEIPDVTKSYAMMVIQFALIKGLLIGTAAYHKKNFGTVHVIDVVQTAFKHFEHNQKFLNDAYALLSARGLIHPRGLAILVRN